MRNKSCPCTDQFPYNDSAGCKQQPPTYSLRQFLLAGKFTSLLNCNHIYSRKVFVGGLPPDYLDDRKYRFFILRTTLMPLLQFTWYLRDVFLVSLQKSSRASLLVLDLSLWTGRTNFTPSPVCPLEVSCGLILILHVSVLLTLLPHVYCILGWKVILVRLCVCLHYQGSSLSLSWRTTFHTCPYVRYGGVAPYKLLSTQPHRGILHHSLAN